MAIYLIKNAHAILFNVAQRQRLIFQLWISWISQSDAICNLGEREWGVPGGIVAGKDFRLAKKVRHPFRRDGGKTSLGIQLRPRAPRP
jgi:hypothetical protein